MSAHMDLTLMQKHALATRPNAARSIAIQDALQLRCKIHSQRVSASRRTISGKYLNMEGIQIARNKIFPFTNALMMKNLTITFVNASKQRAAEI